MYELWIYKMLIKSKLGRRKKDVLWIAITLTFHLFATNSSFASQKNKYREIWEVIKFYGKVIGYSVVRLKGDRVEERIEMKLKAMGEEREIKTSLDWEKNPDFSLRSFHFRLKSKGVENRVSGRVIDNKLLLVKIKRSENKIRIRGKVFTGSSFLFLLEGKINSLKKKSGRIKEDSLQKIYFELDYFDPSILRAGTLKVRYYGRKGKFFVFVKEFAGVSSFLLFDEKGDFVGEEGPAGISAEVSTREEVMRAKTEEIDIIFSTSVKVEGDKLPPSDRRERKKLRSAIIEIRGVDSIPSFPPRQIVESKRYDVLRIKLQRKSLTDKGGIDKLTKAEPLIESDSPEIRKVAYEIAGGKNSKPPRGKVAKELMRKVSVWVFRNLRKTSSLGMPSALDVIKSREGDCNEHAVLATAILRAMGIPARIVFGLVYDSGYFYYHAWVEGFDGEKWIEFDPTWNYFPADVLRIRVGTGNISQWAKVLEYVGRIKVKFVDFN